MSPESSTDAAVSATGATGAVDGGGALVGTADVGRLFPLACAAAAGCAALDATGVPGVEVEGVCVEEGVDAVPAESPFFPSHFLTNPNMPQPASAKPTPRSELKSVLISQTPSMSCIPMLRVRIARAERAAFHPVIFDSSLSNRRCLPTHSKTWRRSGCSWILLKCHRLRGIPQHDLPRLHGILPDTSLPQVTALRVDRRTEPLERFVLLLGVLCHDWTYQSIDSR